MQTSPKNSELGKEKEIRGGEVERSNNYGDAEREFTHTNAHACTHTHANHLIISKLRQ